MKKYLFYIVALIAAACILDGCRKNELQEEPGPPPEIYVRTPKVYPGKGGAFSLLFSIENPREGVEPELSSGESWIRDLAAGEGRITFTLDQNPSSTESRKGNISISYKGAEPVSVEITQAGMDQAVITVKEPEVFGCEGGSGTIMYSIENPREGVGPEVSCEESWISGLSAGEGRITFTLSVNESVKSRKGTISISYMEAEPVSVEITQAGQEQSVIKVENPEAEFDYNGGSGSVKYSIEKPREGDKLQATCSDSWITGITVGSGSISFKVSKNTDEAERNAEIKLTYGNAEPAKIVVKQQEFIPAVIEVPETVTLDAFDLKGSFTYRIRNPREGAQLKATSQHLSIKDVTVTDSEITFSILFNANNGTRRASILLEYEDAQSVTVRVEQSGSNPTWLDGSETANCYIVTEPGVYCFSAVKGNTSEPVGEIASVDVYWETYNDNSQEPEEGPNKDLLIKNVVCYRANTIDRIYFRTSDEAGQYPFWWTTGNALITAKDQNGIILWSWHIWIPKGMPKDQVYPKNGTMMDRNLGATYSGKCEKSSDRARYSGLLYQWGRKDPFIHNDSRVTFHYKNPEVQYTDSEAYTIANPAIYVKDLSMPANSWPKDGKGKYDPCPPGYKVPKVKVWENFWNSTHTSAINEEYQWYCTDFFTGMFTLDECWYHFGGGRDSSGSTERDETYYWSSSFTAGSEHREVFTLYMERKGYATPPLYTLKGRVPLDISAGSWSVRCMKDE